MKTKALCLGISLCASATFSQEVYGTWGHFRSIMVNTTAGGANVPVTMYKFPVLVRLNSTNFNFALAKGDGRDFRFSKRNGLPLKYQIESWDSAGQSAAVWVLLDTVLGNNNVANFRIYYGKTGVADSSKGSAVFDTANGFQGVFHLAEATNDTIRDATTNRFKGVPRNVGGQNPHDTIGVIGKAKNFLGNVSSSNGGSYRLETSADGNTYTRNALNFQNDSVTRGGIIQYTLSAWINVSVFPNGIGTRKGIVTKSKGVNGEQYQLRLIEPFPDQTNSSNDSNRVSFSDGPAVTYQNRATNFTANAWFYLTTVRLGPVGLPTSLRMCLDARCFLGTTTTLVTTRSDYDVTIGGFSNDSGFFSGSLDEVRFENVARDSNWIKLSYETQKPNSAVVAISADSLPFCWCEWAYRINPLVLKANVAMTPDSVIGSTGTITAWVVSPTLPAGLTISGTTGVISGTPTVPQAAANYTVTGLGPGGSSPVVVSISVNTILGISSQPYIVHIKGLGQYAFQIPEGISSVRLSAEDVMGHVVWNRNFDVPKNRTLSWNGSGMDGRQVSPGMYVVRFINLSR